ncbi:MAG: O-antigen ligase family protein [Chitinophagaceae bacterium]
MTPEQPGTIDLYKKQRQVFTALGAGITGSLVFLPLLTSFFSIFLFLYWAILATKKFSSNQNRLLLVLLFSSIYVLAIIGSFYSANTGEALFRLQQKTPLALFPLVFGTSVAMNKEVFHRIFISFVWFTLAGCLFCLGNGLMSYIQTGSTQMLHGYQMIVLRDMSPFMLGLFCLLSAMYLLHTLFKNKFAAGKEKRVYLGVLIMLSVFLFVLGNRNVLFSWSVVITFFFLKNIAGRTVRIAFFVVLATAFALTTLFNPSFHRQWKDLTDFSSSNSIQLDADKSLGRTWGGKAIRLAIWTCSMDIIRDHWLTGVGTGDAQDSLQASYEKRQFYFASRYNAYNAHNQFIQETIAYGIAGFILFTACLLVPMFLFAQSANRQLYWLFLLSFFIICLTESILEISKGIVFYSFFNSIFAFVPMNSDTSLQTKKRY